MSLGRWSFAPFAAVSAGLLLGFLAVSVGWAAGRPAPARQAPPQAPSGDVRFAGNAAFIINYIKTDKAADFEAVMASVKAALGKSPAPERRQQAAGWKIFKTSDAAPEGQVVYVSVIDPVVTGADYSVPKILSEVFPADVRAMYDRYVATFGKGQERIGATLVAARGQ